MASTLIKGQQPAYAPPSVHPVHVTPEQWPAAIAETPAHERGGWALRVLLNTRSGAFTAELNKGHSSPGGKPADRSRGGNYYDPGRDLWIHAWQWDHTPTWIAWEVRGHYGRGHWASNAGEVNAMLDRLAGHAQALLDALLPIPGTADYDWSLRATAAHHRIDHVTESFPHHQIGDDSHHPYFGAVDAPLAERHSYGVVTLTEVLAAAPDLADPKWAAMGDAELDQVAARWTGSADVHPRFIPPAAEETLRLRHFGRDNWGLPIYVIGARTGLRAFRDQAVTERTGLPAVDAAARDLILPETFSADLDDPGLERMAAEIEATAAHEDKIALVGVVDELRRLRTELRRAVRAEASTVGARTAAAEEALTTLRATRAGLLLRIVGWGEEPEWKESGQVDFAAVGRLGSMTRQAARKMLAPYLADGGTDTAEE